MKITFDPIIKATAVEAHIINAICAYPEQFIRSTSNEFAAAFHFSPSALSRFARKFQFANYTALKIYVAHQMQLNSAPQETVEAPTSNSSFIANRSTIRGLSRDLQRAKSVLTYGMGASALPAQFMSLALNSAGISTKSVSDFHSMLEQLTTTSQQDLIVIFSRMMRSNEINFLLKTIDQMQLNYYYVTANPNHPLNATSKHILIKTTPRPTHFEELAEARNAMLSVVDQVMLDIMHRLPVDRVKQAKRETVQNLIKEWKKSS